jgi:hypothetical protein
LSRIASCSARSHREERNRRGIEKHAVAADACRTRPPIDAGEILPEHGPLFAGAGHVPRSPFDELANVWTTIGAASSTALVGDTRAAWISVV